MQSREENLPFAYFGGGSEINSKFEPTFPRTFIDLELKYLNEKKKKKKNKNT